MRFALRCVMCHAIRQGWQAHAASGYTLSYVCAHGVRAVVDALCVPHRLTLEDDPSDPLGDLARRVGGARQ